jgi:hypothetical protein
MEFTPSVFNTFSHQNLIRISAESIKTEIDQYDLPQKVKRQLIILSNVIRKYKTDELPTRAFPNDTQLVFLLMCVIANYRIKNNKIILNADVSILDTLQEKVKENEIQEMDYLGFCANLKTHTVITDFYESVCYCCSSYQLRNGNLCVDGNYL